MGKGSLSVRGLPSEVVDERLEDWKPRDSFEMPRGGPLDYRRLNRDYV